MNELKNDHRDIRRQLFALTSSEEKDKVNLIVEKLNRFVLSHTRLLNEALQVLIRRADVTHELVVDIMENQQDVQVIEDLLSKLRNLKTKDEQWSADVQALSSLLELHLKDEEEVFFPKITQHLCS